MFDRVQGVHPKYEKKLFAHDSKSKSICSFNVFQYVYAPGGFKNPEPECFSASMLCGFIRHLSLYEVSFLNSMAMSI